MRRALTKKGLRALVRSGDELATAEAVVDHVASVGYDAAWDVLRVLRPSEAARLRQVLVAARRRPVGGVH